MDYDRLLKKCWNDAQDSAINGGVSFDEWYTKNLPCSSEDVVAVIDHWKEFYVLPRLLKADANVRKIVANAIRKHGIYECMNSISNYAKIIGTEEYFFKYKWDIRKFFTQSNAAPQFFSDGTGWINFSDWANTNIKSEKPIPYSKMDESLKGKIKERANEIIGFISRHHWDCFSISYIGDDYEQERERRFNLFLYDTYPVALCKAINEFNGYLDINIKHGSNSFIEEWGNVVKYDGSGNVIGKFNIITECSKLGF